MFNTYNTFFSKFNRVEAVLLINLSLSSISNKRLSEYYGVSISTISRFRSLLSSRLLDPENFELLKLESDNALEFKKFFLSKLDMLSYPDALSKFKRFSINSDAIFNGYKLLFNYESEVIGWEFYDLKIK